jgi:hypothetical protein
VPINHTVKSGECITSIADEFGFFWDTVWNDPSNAELVLKRGNPNTLVAGDIVVIPDKRFRQVECETGAIHRFRKKGIPAQIRLRFLDGDRPRANETYTIDIDGVVATGLTNADGELRISVPANSKKGFITIGPDGERIELRVGELEPATELKGVQDRLNNLGYDCGDVTGSMNDPTRKALMQFQGVMGLEETGVADEVTISALQSMHETDAYTVMGSTNGR